MKIGDVEIPDDTIAHYGVKGMKWGVRRSRAQIDADSEDATRVKNIRAKAKTNRTTNVLSNKELQDAITRMNLERQYSSLTAKPSTVKRGQSAAKDLVSLGNTINAVIQFKRSPAGQIIDRALRPDKKVGS